MRKTKTMPFLHKQGLTIKLFICLLTGVLVPLAVAGVVYYTRLPFGIPLFALVFLVTFTGIVAFLNQKITIPLYEMAEIAEKMAEGDLGKTMPENTWDEISKISSNINEFSVNHQEILLHFWNRSRENIKTVEKIMADIKPTKNNASCELDILLEKLLDDIRQTHSMTDSFIFFDVTTDDGKALAVNDSYSRRTI